MSAAAPALDKPLHGVSVVESEGIIGSSPGPGPGPSPSPLAAMMRADLDAQTAR